VLGGTLSITLQEWKMVNGFQALENMMDDYLLTKATKIIPKTKSCAISFIEKYSCIGRNVHRLILSESSISFVWKLHKFNWQSGMQERGSEIAQNHLLPEINLGKKCGKGNNPWL
jgi:hypothetical protein